MTNLEIGSGDRLEIEPISRQDGVAWTVRLVLVQRQELSAAVENAYLIPEAGEAQALVAFLADVSACHWTGWSGAKSWESLEHNLAIEATWQRTGGATLRVTLVPEGQRWQARGTIEIDDMALERLGTRARAVLIDAPPPDR